MKKSFWRLAPPLSLQKLAEWEDGKVELEGVSCPVCEGHQRAGRRLTNLSVILPSGPIGDFVWTWYGELLVQDRALDVLRANGLAGFEVKTANARFQGSTDQPPPLWEIVVTGWAGMADPASGIRLDKQKSCDACGELLYTGLVRPDLLIDNSKWDGSDFFMVWPLPKFVFVTDRVVRTLREHNLTGVRSLKASEVEPPADGFGPGRLSYWMSEARAKVLGRPFGID
jgi:hypothetical protein